MSKWIKKDDKVVVTSGNDKGRMGTVLSRHEDKVIIQGINIRKKHLKQRSKAPSPGSVEKEMPISISNISLCTADGKPIKVKVSFDAKGNKNLVYTEQNKEIIHRQIKKSKAD